MTTNLVFRELPDDLWRDLYDDDAAETGAFARAVMRAHAELLVADALAMQVGTYRRRSDSRREADAESLVLDRLRTIDEPAAARGAA